MSRVYRPPRRARPDAREPASSERCHRARTVEGIGTEALALAKRARAAGLTVAAHLLEMAAMEAGVEAAAQQWPRDPRAPDGSS